MLRNPLDVAPTETNGVRMAGLMGTASTAPMENPRAEAQQSLPKEVVVAPPRRRPPRPIVETIRAGKRTVEDVK